MNLYYLSSSGEKIDLNSDIIWPEDPESLLKSEWSYSVSSEFSKTAQMQSTFRKTASHTLKINILAESSDDYDTIMRSMENAFDADVVNVSPGKLYWNNSYRNVFVIKREYENYTEFADTIDAELTILSLNPAWIEDITVSVKPAATTSDLTIPATIPFVIPVTQKNTSFKLDHYAESDFKLTAYGPTTQLYVTIADHLYEVNHEIESGQYLTIDSRPTTPADKQCFLTKADGTTVNCFNDRGEASIFQKIPAGSHQISYSLTYGIDLTIFKERSDPRWT